MERTGTMVWTEGELRSVEEVAGRGVRIAHLSDPHLGKEYDDHHFGVFAWWLEGLSENGVDVIAISGDIVHLPNDRLAMERARDMLEQTGLPCVVVPGNHDVAIPGAPEAFGRSFGDFPRLETHCGVDFLLFDSFDPVVPADRSDAELELAATGFFSHGRVDAAQFDHFESELAGRTAPRVAVVHHYLFESDEPDLPDFLRPLENADEFLDWCAAHEVRAILYGHAHPDRAPRLHDGMLCLRGGRCTKPPMRARVVTLGESGAWIETFELAYESMTEPHEG